MKAIKTVAVGRAEIVDAPIPSLDGYPAYVLVKTSYVALNQCENIFTDWDEAFIKNRTIGSEFAGTVIEAGPLVTKFKKGDDIAGYTFAGGPAGGCLAEYIIVKGDAQLKLGEEAAGVGVAIATACEALFVHMKLPPLGKSDAVVFIYGGSSSTGQMAIQLAKLSGATVVTTCSPHNFELVKSLGAIPFDYHDSVCASKVKEYGPRLVMDCIGTFDSPKICAELLEEGLYCSVSPSRVPGVENVFLQGEVMLGEPYNIANINHDGDEAMFERGKEFMSMAEALLKSGRLRPPRYDVIPFDEALRGLQELREWKVSGKKYVCKMP